MVGRAAVRSNRMAHYSMVRSPDGDAHVTSGRSAWRPAPKTSIGLVRAASSRNVDSMVRTGETRSPLTCYTVGMLATHRHSLLLAAVLVACGSGTTSCGASQDA